MAAKYGHIPARRLSGQEPFLIDGRAAGTTTLDYWQWLGSELLGNAERGALAEFIVALALGVAGGVRADWRAYDLVSPEEIRVEVKASAYIQTWEQQRLSRPSFSIARRKSWDPVTNTTGTECKRHSDVYVFALLAHTDQATLNPLDVGQWRFFVLATAVLDRLGRQKSLALSRLGQLGAVEVPYAGIRAAVDQAGKSG